MWMETDCGPTLGLHLGMAGHILIDGNLDPESLVARRHWNRFVVHFEDGGSLALRDKRRLSRAVLEPAIERLGPDAGEMSRAAFRTCVGRGGAPIKARLMDQQVIAGVGNLLADETLWRAHLDPRRAAGSLSSDELDRLRRELRAAIRSAIRDGGVHTGQMIRSRRRGASCPRCGAEMRRATIGGRTTWWCPSEQS